MEPKPRDRSRRLTPDEIDRIIELRLRGVSVRNVAAELDTTTRTVQTHWTRYRQKDAVDRVKKLDAIRAGYAAQQEELADAATLDALESTDPSERARAIDAATKARMSAAKLQGLDVQRVEHTGADGGPIQVTDPKLELLERLRRLAPEGND
jgi:DNA-binding NarL/FixJ family response regulator